MESLTIDPSLAVEVTHEYSVRQTDGPIMRQRNPVHSRKRRRFRVPFELLSIAQKNEIVALFDAVRGRAGRFLFTPPDEDTALECKFASDAQQWASVGAARRSMTLEFYEAF